MCDIAYVFLHGQDISVRDMKPLPTDKNSPMVPLEIAEAIQELKLYKALP